MIRTWWPLLWLFSVTHTRPDDRWAAHSYRRASQGPTHTYLPGLKYHGMRDADVPLTVNSSSTYERSHSTSTVLLGPVQRVTQIGGRRLLHNGYGYSGTTRRYRNNRRDDYGEDEDEDDDADSGGTQRNLAYFRHSIEYIDMDLDGDLDAFLVDYNVQSMDGNDMGYGQIATNGATMVISYLRNTQVENSTTGPVYVQEEGSNPFHSFQCTAPTLDSSGDGVPGTECEWSTLECADIDGDGVQHSVPLNCIARAVTPCLYLSCHRHYLILWRR